MKRFSLNINIEKNFLIAKEIKWIRKKDEGFQLFSNLGCSRDEKLMNFTIKFSSFDLHPLLNAH
jgi:hypothetical protein